VGEKILQLSTSHAERKSSGVPRLSEALEKKLAHWVVVTPTNLLSRSIFSLRNWLFISISLDRAPKSSGEMLKASMGVRVKRKRQSTKKNV